jgi:hypothetical protein
MKRITINIQDDNYDHVQAYMKELGITESEAVEYFIEKDRIKFFTKEEIELVKSFLDE